MDVPRAARRAPTALYPSAPMSSAPLRWSRPLSQQTPDPPGPPPTGPRGCRGVDDLVVAWFPAGQQPDWPDPVALDGVLDRLRVVPPLVFAGEARALLAGLGEVCEGRAFLLQAGECVESFRDVSAPAIRERAEGSAADVGRSHLRRDAPGGQGGAPRRVSSRSRGPSRRRRSTVSSCRPSAGTSCTRTSRHRSADPDPERLLQGYYQAASTLNLLRAFTKGGFADLTRAHVEPRVRGRVAGGSALRGARRRDRACAPLHAVDRDRPRQTSAQPARGRRLDESRGAAARVRGGPHAHRLAHGRPYDCSAHMLWIGERTRDIDGAHVEFFSESTTRSESSSGRLPPGEDAVALAERLNPADPGPPDVHHAHGRGACARGVASASCTRCSRLGFPSSGCATRCTRTSSACPPGRRRAASTRSWRSCTASSRASRGRHVAGRRAPRVHRRGRDGMSRRVGGRARGSARQPLRDALRPTPERAPVAGPGVPGRRAHAGRLSTSPCGWRSSARG